MRTSLLNAGMSSGAGSSKRQASAAGSAMRHAVAAVLAAMLVLAITFAASAVVRADGLQYTETANGNMLVIADNAGLYSESDKSTLADSMRPITGYCNVLLLTTDSNYSTQENYAYTQGKSIFGSDASFTVFLIDMDNRQIYIGSTADIRKTLSTARANTITDNVYKYASKGDYTGCASAAFDQMFTILEGGNIPAPMKIIGCALIALIGGLTVCYIIMSGAGKMKTASVHEIEEGMGRNEITVANINKRRISSHFVASSSGGHGGGGHGGGGFSGGGGGGGGFGGGGHGF